jgi:hypothetical protein
MNSERLIRLYRANGKVFPLSECTQESRPELITVCLDSKKLVAGDLLRMFPARGSVEELKRERAQ